MGYDRDGSPEPLERQHRRLLEAAQESYGDQFGRASRQADASMMRAALRVAEGMGLPPGRLADRLAAGNRRAQLAVLGALTNKETYLYREPEALLAVRDTLFPLADPGHGSFRVLSAACSRGHEVVSLWVMLESKREALGLPEGSFSLCGLDLSAEALQEARRALDWEEFRCNRMGPGRVPEPVRRASERMLEERGKDLWRLRPGYEARGVRLVQWDLLRPPPADLAADAVLFRNVLIHHGEEARSTLVANATGLLAPGGLLFLGAAESLLGGEAHGLRHVRVGSTRAYSSE